MLLGMRRVSFLLHAFSNGLQFAIDYESPVTIAEVDRLLDELASSSGFTDNSIRKKYPKAKHGNRDHCKNNKQ